MVKRHASKTKYQVSKLSNNDITSNEIQPLTDWALVILNCIMYLVNTAPGNGLLPDSIKPSPELMWTRHLLRSLGIHLRAISFEIQVESYWSLKFV